MIIVIAVVVLVGTSNSSSNGSCSSSDNGMAELVIGFIPTWGDGVAQLVERRTQDSMNSVTRGSNPIRSTGKICEFF